MNKYEYKVINERNKLGPDDDVDAHLEARLNYWGWYGWRIFKVDTKAVDVHSYEKGFGEHEVVGVDFYIHAVARRENEVGVQNI